MLRNSSPSYSFAREPSGGFSGSVFFVALEDPGIAASRTTQMPRFRKIFFREPPERRVFYSVRGRKASDSLLPTARRQRCVEIKVLARSAFRVSTSLREREVAVPRRD